jgi:hypothetical protein
MRHWAEDFHHADDLAPKDGDEALFLSLLMVGVENLRSRYVNDGCLPAIIDRHTCIEKFCREYHKQGDAAVTAVWVRYEIWRDRQQLTQESK